MARIKKNNVIKNQQKSLPDNLSNVNDLNEYFLNVTNYNLPSREIIEFYSDHL